jgi:hypothetical protein
MKRFEIESEKKEKHLQQKKKTQRPSTKDQQG